MTLYRYRPIDSALKEIEYGTLHFASREELNDPMEGYVRVYWQADRAAWEGLFRNYVCSLSQAIDLYLLQGNEDMLHHKTLIVDLHRYDNVPLGEMLKKLGDKFLEDKEILNIAAFYGAHNLKVREDELRLILHFVHRKALVLCIQTKRENKLIPESEADQLLKFFSSFKEPAYPVNLMDADLPNPDERDMIIKFAEDLIEDMRDFQYVSIGFDDETFLYGLRKDKQGKVIADEMTEARQRRNWLAVAAEFPRIYVDQLKNMVFPTSFVVCFSGKNNDSAMWGNYARNHCGVCLVYETDADNMLTVWDKNQSYHLPIKKVAYGGEVLERNFFETFGHMTRAQIETWLTGVEGKSSALQAFSKEDEWRNHYWESYDAKTYRKLKDWEYEDEYRVVLGNSLYSYETPESRNLQVVPKSLVGIIFGIKTSEYDKKRIMEKLLEHAEEYEDFVFYQAEYNDEKQTITVRKKNLWRLK